MARTKDPLAVVSQRLEVIKGNETEGRSVAAAKCHGRRLRRQLPLGAGSLLPGFEVSGADIADQRGQQSEQIWGT